jgi:hypothetical protein
VGVTKEHGIEIPGALRRIVQFSVDQAVDFDRDRIGRGW